MAVSAHAQALGLNDNLSGSLVTDVDDINQCIHIILHTPKSADPLRPTFGCDQDKYLDSPINIARPHLVREITDALRQWEPRIVVTRVSVELVDIAQLAAGDKIVFGATVVLVDCDTDEERTYQIVGDLEADIRENRISVSSPVARALIGKSEGDVVEVKAPAGVREYEILSISYV